MKSESAYARRVNQKLACAEVLLTLQAADSDKFAVQALVESVYLQMELALGFYGVEVQSKYGLEVIPSHGNMVELGALTAYIRSPATEIFEMNELRILSTDPESWYSHCVAVCCTLRRVSDPGARMKSSIFDQTEGGVPKDNNLIAIASAADAENGLSLHIARSTLKALREFIERNRAAGVEC